MTQAGKDVPVKPGSPLITSAVLSIGIQVGCLTFAIIILALVAGLVLDRQLDTLPLFTILFLVGSMPLSWVLVFWLVNRVKAKFIQNPAASAVHKPSVWEDEKSD
jgi:hypothetical protein